MPGPARVPSSTVTGAGAPNRSTWPWSKSSITLRFCRPHSSTSSKSEGTSKLTLVMVAKSASSMNALTRSSVLPSRRA